jgi:hypothetical protein
MHGLLPAHWWVQEDEAERIVAELQARGVIARVARPGAFQFGIRIPLGDGREALWDTDGTAGLEAQVMRDGLLVGFVPQIPGSEAFTDDQVIEAIVSADYGPG